MPPEPIGDAAALVSAITGAVSDSQRFLAGLIAGSEARQVAAINQVRDELRGEFARNQAAHEQLHFRLEERLCAAEGWIDNEKLAREKAGAVQADRAQIRDQVVARIRQLWRPVLGTAIAILAGLGFIHAEGFRLPF